MYFLFLYEFLLALLTNSSDLLIYVGYSRSSFSLLVICLSSSLLFIREKEQN